MGYEYCGGCGYCYRCVNPPVQFCDLYFYRNGSGVQFRRIVNIPKKVAREIAFAYLKSEMANKVVIQNQDTGEEITLENWEENREVTETKIVES